MAYGYTQLEWDAEVDPKSYPVWICFGSPIPITSPWKPLPITHYLEALQIACKSYAVRLSLPRSLGYDERIKDGRHYVAMMEGKPEEAPEREKAYWRFMEPIIEDFEGAWDKAMAEWLPVVNSHKERCHPEQLKKLSDLELFELLEHYELHCHRRCQVDYFTWLDASMSIYATFADLCEELTGIDIEHPTFKDLLGGFDTIAFRINKELWRLGDRAKELGLAQLFLTTENDEELMSKLEDRDEGRKWLEEYSKFLDAYGWRCPGFTDCSNPSWIERPSLGLRDVKAGIAKGGPFVLDIERERLVKQREKAEEEVLAKVPSEQREWFTKLMRMAEKSSWFQEEHSTLTAILDTAIARHIFMEYGRRFAQAGVIDEQEDVFFLTVPVIKKAAIATKINLRPYVDKYREEWESYLKIEPQLFIGDVPRLAEQARMEPTLRIGAGMPRVKPELKADLYGASSVPGVAEGTARVIVSEKELGQVKPGEILVAPVTNTLWTPIFGIISAVVTDMGGSLAHAAIVAREYGIPAVVGTLAATQAIRTGDRIRVDGNMNAVYILK